MKPLIDRIAEEHTRHRALAEQLLETSGNSDERRELWRAFRKEVEAHADAEEQTLYAALIAKPEAQDRSQHSIAEHRAIHKLMRELEDTDFSSPGWLSTARDMVDKLRHHMVEEEEEVFPLLLEQLSAEERAEVAERFGERKTAELQQT
jgi:hemerythrin superfamily protein